MPRSSRRTYLHLPRAPILRIPSITSNSSPARLAMTALALAIPVELLHQICENLHQPDLKNFRLVCTHFRLTAEEFLFRHILLRRNPESSMRLRLIADHSEIRNHVRSLCYDPRLFTKSRFCEDFEQWNEVVLGHEEDHFNIRFVTDYADKAERKELQAHYQRYCALVHSDEPMQKYEVETQDLISGFSRLPNLRDVCFIFDEEDFCPSRFRPLSSITLETLIFPDSVHGWLHGKTFTGLLKAAHAVQISLKSIKAFGMPWSVFQQSEEVSSMMASATKSCQHLAIDVDPDDDPENGRGNGRRCLAKMISSSSSLHTLEISLGDVENSRWGDWRLGAKLFEVIDHKSHWTYLKRLRLQAFASTDIHLKDLLTRHTSTLRSLELANFKLEPYTLDGKNHHGSWIEIIMFLESSLSLENVRLDGVLYNGNDELWCVHDSSKFKSTFRCRQEGPCLNDLIKKFIVEGGTCPLPFPHASDRPADWKHLTDFSWADWTHSSR